MKNKTQQLTLLTCAVMAFLITLAEYVWNGGDPFYRLGYAAFMSVTPALAVWLLLRLSKLSLSWRRMIGVYIMLFAVTQIVQSYARMI